MLDLLIGWFADALQGFPWIWPTFRNARTITLLNTRMDSTCHKSPINLSDMKSGVRAADVLCFLCQDFRFCKDVLDTGTHRLLQTADKARLMQRSRPGRDDPVGSLALDIQLAVIECVLYRDHRLTLNLGSTALPLWVGRSRQHGTGPSKPCWP